MKLGIIAFTAHGHLLGERLLEFFEKEGEEVKGFVKSNYVELTAEHRFWKVEESLSSWAAQWVPLLDGIIFISATGIAVRGIAPFVKDKKTDPAVVVIDEQGNYAISLLSGHLGGANLLAQKAAKVIGAQAVITTATDVNHTFAVDVFAKKNGLQISDMTLAKEMAALLVQGKKIPWGAGAGFVYPENQKIPEALVYQEGESPDGRKGTLWFLLENGKILHLWKKTICLGIGCKKGTAEENIAVQVERCLEKEQIALEQIQMAASIDLKKEETGLLAYCQRKHLPFVTYTSQELQEAKGNFTPSSFVSKITGVDNVCERSASVASEGGVLIMKKQAAEGVTTACAIKKWSVDFE